MTESPPIRRKRRWLVPALVVGIAAIVLALHAVEAVYTARVAAYESRVESGGWLIEDSKERQGIGPVLVDTLGQARIELRPSESLVLPAKDSPDENLVIMSPSKSGEGEVRTTLRRFWLVTMADMPKHVSGYVQTTLGGPPVSQEDLLRNMMVEPAAATDFLAARYIVLVEPNDVIDEPVLLEAAPTSKGVVFAELRGSREDLLDPLPYLIGPRLKGIG